MVDLFFRDETPEVKEFNFSELSPKEQNDFCNQVIDAILITKALERSGGGIWNQPRTS